MRLAVGADCVVRNSAGEILLIKREDFRIWTIPGGRMEPGESPAQAAARETLEESGVEAVIDELAGIYSSRRAASLIFVYTAHPVGGAPRPTPEAVDSRYFAPHALPARMTGMHRQRVYDALSSQRGLYRQQARPLWASLLVPSLIRARRLRNRLQGRPETPAVRHAVIAQGMLSGSDSGEPLSVEVVPQPGQPIWETLCQQAERISGARILVGCVLDVRTDGAIITVQFGLRRL
jgi:ADP-ribose pyrophosphatase YjhB (NUDIX family)